MPSDPPNLDRTAPKGLPNTSVFRATVAGSQADPARDLVDDRMKKTSKREAEGEASKSGGDAESSKATGCVKPWMGKKETRRNDERNHHVTEIHTLLRTIYDVIIDEEQRQVPDPLRVVRFGPDDKGFVIVNMKRFEREIHSVSDYGSLFPKLWLKKGFSFTTLSPTEMLWLDENCVFARGRRNDFYLIKASKDLAAARKRKFDEDAKEQVRRVKRMFEPAPNVRVRSDEERFLSLGRSRSIVKPMMQWKRRR